MSNHDITVMRPHETAIGGGIQGAERLDRETALWSPAMGSPDAIINRGKPLADARGRDLALNDGLTHGAVNVHKDSVVGSQYRLNSQPNSQVMADLTGNKAFDDDWAEEFSEAAENYFGLIAESESCWLDSSRAMKLTDQIRLAVGDFVVTGETLATSDWLNKDPRRPCMTATQLVSPSRLSNPNLQMDTQFLRRGVQKDARGRAQGYWIQVGYPRDNYGQRDAQTWKYVPAEKPWGRKQVLHLLERQEVGQSRGIADMVSALGHTNMAKKHNALTLQQAVVSASYAATLESELPPDAVYAIMGQNSADGNFSSSLGMYMDLLKRFFGDAGTMQVDGVKIPVLPPGTKFNSKTLGTPGGVGDDFQKSLHRHTAAALGLSEAEYSKDWSGLSYTTARAAGSSMERFMRSRKKLCADGVANFNYQLFLEEFWVAGKLPMPVGVRPRRLFYEIPLVKEALSQASWIGSGSGQIDELKETQAALLRISGGLSTREKEIARLGDDWRPIFKQLAREQAASVKLGLDFSTVIARPNGATADDPAADPASDPTPAPKPAKKKVATK